MTDMWLSLKVTIFRYFTCHVRFDYFWVDTPKQNRFERPNSQLRKEIEERELPLCRSIYYRARACANYVGVRFVVQNGLAI